MSSPEILTPLGIAENPVYRPSSTEAIESLLSRITSPKPPQRIRQQCSSVLVRVSSVAEFKPIIVTRKLKGGRHLLIGQRPIAELVVEIVGTVLKENPNGFAFRF